MKKTLILSAFLMVLIMLAGCTINEKIFQPRTHTMAPPTTIKTPVTTVSPTKPIVPTPVPTYQPVLYESKEMGYRINYDKTWDFSTSSFFNGAIFFHPPSGKQIISITKWPVNGLYDIPVQFWIQDFIPSSEAKMKRNYTLIEIGTTKVSGYPAGTISYKENDGYTESKNLDYKVPTKDYLYMISYSAPTESYDQYESLFKQMVSSFEPI
jgi:hypothetical protein